MPFVLFLIYDTEKYKIYLKIIKKKYEKNIFFFMPSGNLQQNNNNNK